MGRLVLALVVLFVAVWLWSKLPRGPRKGSPPTLGSDGTDVTSESIGGPS